MSKPAKNEKGPISLRYKCRNCEEQFTVVSKLNLFGVRERLAGRLPLDKILFAEHDCFPFAKGMIGLADFVGAWKLPRKDSKQ